MLTDNVIVRPILPGDAELLLRLRLEAFKIAPRPMARIMIMLPVSLIPPGLTWWRTVSAMAIVRFLSPIYRVD